MSAAVAEWFVRDEGLVPGLASFNAFMDGGLQAVVEALHPLVLRREMHHGEGELHVTFESFTLKEWPETPDGRRMFPSEALATKALYGVPMRVQARATLHPEGGPGRAGGEPAPTKEFEFLLMHVPVMVRSNYCSLRYAPHREPRDDPGGYFIVGGQERVFVLPERGVFNTLQRGDRSVTVRSARADGPASWVTLSEVDGEYVCTCSLFSDARKNMVPLVLVFAALGASPLPPALRDGAPPSRHAALYHLAQVTRACRDLPLQAMSDRLHTHLLPHTSAPLAYLEYMLEELRRAGGGGDDRDSIGAKTIHTPYRLMSQLVRHALRRFMARVTRRVHVGLAERGLRAAFDSLHTVFQARTVTSEVVRAFTRDQWPPAPANGGASNIVELLRRSNVLDLLCHLRRVRAAVHENNKDISLRQIHFSQYGFVCPAETPENVRTTGIVKSLALLATLSVRRTLSLALPDALFGAGATGAGAPATGAGVTGAGARVFVNGHLLPRRAKGELLRAWLVHLRRTRRLPFDVSVTYLARHDEVHVRSEEGRLLRALLVAPPGASPAALETHLAKLRARMAERGGAFRDLVHEGWVEFLDANEQMHNALIAETPADARPGVTHVEITPSAMFGVTVNMMPWANHNQGPRATYFGNMAKQLVGRPFPGRRTGDTLAYALDVVQRPVCATAVSRMLERYLDALPLGQTLVVAIAVYGGHNVDDSIMFSQKSADLGAMRMTTYHTYKIALLEHQKWAPAPGSAAAGRYDAQGCINVGETVHAGEVLAHIDGAPGNYVLPPGARGRVHSVAVVDARTVHVRVRVSRPPTIGDKTTSWAGQKGVIGQLMRPEDLPFSLETGITPDVIINPHAFPSRMTMAYLVELVASKLALAQGRSRGADATSFEPVDLEELMAGLHALGMRGDGRERLVCGFSGAPMAEPVCLGPLYMSRLKRIAEEQLFARARGPVMSLTRQPPPGRANDGAMRFGEMEVGAVIAHGAPHVLQDRTVLSSDAFMIRVCRTCERVVDLVPCPHCRGANSILPVRTRYPFDLVRQELRAVGIQLDALT